MTVGLFVGRFQPFHLGHLEFVNFALKYVDTLKIVICETNGSESSNPFNVEERMEMIKRSTINPTDKIEYYSVEDTKYDHDWIRNVNETVGEYGYVFTNNTKIRDVFESGTRFKVFNMPNTKHDKINGTIIRRRIIRNESIDDLVPEGTKLVIEAIRNL